MLTSSLRPRACVLMWALALAATNVACEQSAKHKPDKATPAELTPVPEGHPETTPLPAPLVPTWTPGRPR